METIKVKLAAGRGVIRWAISLALCLLTACGGSRPEPQSGWSAAVRLEPRAGVSTILEASYLGGNSPAVAWLFRDATSLHQVVVREREIDGVWRDKLPRFDLGSNAFQSSHRLVTNTSGSALLAWVEQADSVSPLTIRATTHEPGLGWSAIATPAPGTGHPAWHIVAADGQGTFWLVVFEIADDGTRRTWVLRWSAATGWASPQALGPAGLSEPLKVVADAAGRVFVLSLDFGTGASDDQTLKLSRFEPGLGWSAAETVGRHARIGPLADLVVAGGNAWITWTGDTVVAGTDPLNFRSDVYATRCPSASSCEPAARLNAAGGSSASNPQIGATSTGKATAVWDFEGGLQSASYDQLNAWGVQQTVSPASLLSPSYVRIAVSPAGDALTVFSAARGFRGVPHSTRRAEGGTWQVPQPIAEVGDSSPADISLAMSDLGAAIAVWSQQDGSPGSANPGVPYVATFQP